MTTTNHWTREPTGALPPLAFANSVKPRRPRPPLLIKSKSTGGLLHVGTALGPPVLLPPIRQ